MMEVKILEQSCLRIERLFFLFVVLQKIKNKKGKYIRVCRLRRSLVSSFKWCPLELDWTGW